MSEGSSLEGLDDHSQDGDSTPSVVPLNSDTEGLDSTALDEHSVHDGYSERQSHPSAETDLFSDSYTHISPAPVAIHTVEEEEELQQEEEGLDQGRTWTEEVKLSGTPFMAEFSNFSNFYLPISRFMVWTPVVYVFQYLLT